MTTITSTTTPNVSNPDPGPATLLASFQRPNDATAYAVGDVISDNSASARAIAFDGAGHRGLIHSVSIGVEETTTANLELWIFDAEPTNQIDNTAFALTSTVDLQKVVARFSLADAKKVLVGTGLNYYEAFGPTNNEPIGLPRPYTTTNGKLYALLVTRSAYTPTARCLYHVRLGVVRQ